MEISKKNDSFFYKDEKNFIHLNTKNTNSIGLFHNIAMAIKIALDLKIDRKIIIKSFTKIKI